MMIVAFDEINAIRGKYMIQIGYSVIAIKRLSKYEVAFNIPYKHSNDFTFYIGEAYDKKYLFAKPTHKNPTPLQCRKAAESFAKATGMKTIFILDRSKPYERKRLNDQNVFYVSQDGHARLDFEIPKSPYEHDDTPTSLTASAQYILLYHLQVRNLEGMAANEIARIVPYKYTVVAHSLSLLEKLGLCEKILDKTHRRYLHFELKGKELWEKALPLCISPVKDVFFCDEILSEEKFLMCNKSALSVYAGASSEDCTTLVMHIEKFRELKDSGKLVNLNKKEGKIRIEGWRYRAIKSIDDTSEYVDKLSLILSLADSNVKEADLLKKNWTNGFGYKG